MDNTNVLYLLSSLSSGKIKERNNALDELTFILKDKPSRIPTKSLQSVTESLIELLDLEHRRYCDQLSDLSESKKGKLSLIEGRFSTVAYVIRLFVEKTCIRFKQRTLNLYLSVLPELMVKDHSRSLLEPVSMHLSFALLSLIESDPFILKFTAFQWTSIIEKICLYFDEQAKVSITDRTISNFITIIAYLLSLDTVGLFQSSLAIHRTITNFLKLSTKETSDSRLILRIVNQLILKTHVDNISQTLILIRESWNYTIPLNNSSNDAIQDELSHLYIMSSELVVANLPEMVGLETPNFRDEVFLSLFKEIIRIRIKEYRPRLFETSSIKFTRSLQGKSLTLFQLYDIQLKDNCSYKYWIQLFTLLKLLLSYFKFEESPNQIIPLFKKRRIENEYGILLENCINIETFLHKLLSDANSVEHQLLGIQLFTFYASMSDIPRMEVDNFKKLILRKFENTELNSWTVCALVPLISQVSLIFEEDEVGTIFKVCLPLLKDSECCVASSVALSSTIRYTKKHINNTSIISQIFDIYELSDINGPIFICDEAFEFWKSLQSYGVEFESRDGHSAQYAIVEWLKSKWGQIKNVNQDHGELSDFVLWLCSKDMRKGTEFKKREYTNIEGMWSNWVANNEIWNRYNDQRNFLLRTTPLRKAQKADSSFYENLKETQDLNIITDVLSKLLEEIEEESYINPQSRIRLIFQLLRIIYYLSDDHDYDDFARSSKFKLYTIVHLLKFQDKETYLTLFHQIRLQSFNSKLILDFFNLRNIITEFKISYIKSDDRSSVGDEFEMSTITTPTNRSQTLFNGNPSSLASSSDIRLSIEAVFALYYKTDLPKFLLILISFIKDLDSNLLFPCLDPLNMWLLSGNKFPSKFQYNEFEQLTQIIGEKFLSNKYNTYGKTISYLSRYLELIKDQWLNFPNTSLFSDCCDLLNWLIARLEDSSFCSISATKSLAQLSIHILMHPELSQNTPKGTKQKIFQTFVTCLKRIDIASIVLLESSISEYMMNISYKNQSIFLSELKHIIETPQQSLELASVYTLSMANFSTISYPILISCLKDLLSYYKYGHLKEYMKNCIQKIVKMWGLSDRKELFKICKMDLILFWYEGLYKHNGGFNEPWDITIFGFSDLKEFFEEYNVEISAVHISSGSNNELVIEELASIGKINETDILASCYHLAVAFAYVENKIGDLIFYIASQLFGGNFKKYDKQFSLLTFKSVLRFIDLSSLHEQKIALSEMYSDSTALNDLFSDENNSARYLFPLHISLTTGLKFMKEHFSDIFLKNTEMLHSLLLWELSDLEKSKTHIERLRCLREIRYLLIIFRMALPKYQMINGTIIELSKYIADTRIHSEIGVILAFLLKICINTETDISCSLSSVFLNTLMFQKCNCITASHQLREILSIVPKWKNIQLSLIWSICVKLLNDESTDMDILPVDEILLNPNCVDDTISLISLLVSQCKEIKINEINQKPTIESIQKLVNFKGRNEFDSKRFQLWKASYFYEYYRKSYHMPLLVDKNNILSGDRKYPNIDSQSVERFYTTFFDYVENDLTDESCEISFLCDIILCNVLNTKNGGLISNVSEYYSGKFKGRDLPIDAKLFDLIFPEKKTHLDMNDFVTGKYFSGLIAYDEWLLTFTTTLLSSLEYEIKGIGIFYSLFKRSLSFCERIFPFLLGMALHLNFTSTYSSLLTSIQNIDLLKTTEDSRLKQNIIIIVAYFLRHGSTLHKDSSRELFYKLDLKKVIASTLGTPYSKFGLMLYEEIYMENVNVMDIKLLRQLYTSIHEVDLISGLPAPSTLSDALININETVGDPWKRFVFCNAKLDSSYSDNKTVESNILKDAAKVNGFYGLADRVRKDNKSSFTNDDYKWSVQLDKWDLPLPDNLDTKEKSIYYTLKKIQSHNVTILSSVEESLATIVRSKEKFKKSKEWLSTVSEIKILERITRELHFPESVVSILNETSYINKNVTEDSDFNDYKIFLQGRYLLTKNILMNKRDIDSYSLDTLRLVSVSLLRDDIMLSIDNNSPQDSLKNAFIMENLVGTMDYELNTIDLFEICKPVLYFSSAVSLWESQDRKTPLIILSKLLEAVSQGPKSENLEYVPFMKYLNITTDELKGCLVKWSSESRFESPKMIYEKYIKDCNISVADYELRAKIYYIYGNFLNSQVKKLRESEEIRERQNQYESDLKNLQALDVIYRNAKLPNGERKDAKRHYNRVHLQLERDKAVLDSLTVQQEEFIWNSLHFYMNTLVFTNTYDSDVMDKFCSLWFENHKNVRMNNRLQKDISNIPSWKFLPWVSQISSKLNLDGTAFQKPLQLTMKRLLYKLPYDSLYSVISIKLYKNNSISSDSAILHKVAAVEEILNDLRGYDKGNYYKKYLEPIEIFCEMSLDLANIKITEASKKIVLGNLKIGKYWLKTLPSLKLPLPTDYVVINCSEDGRKERPYIISVDEMVQVTSTGISLPKIVNFKTSDGYDKNVLMKGSNDDLRQDAIMEQVFTQVNNILRQNKELRDMNLKIRTYKVIPLGSKAGIIEFVKNSVSLHQTLRDLHENDAIPFDRARRAMKDVQTKTNQVRLDAYLKLTNEIKPQLRNFFFSQFLNYDDWFEAKMTYTKGIATTSMVGYILGLGDRHLNNILLDSSSGEPIHIDLGIAFDQGRLLPIPELVPFRLTRDIIDGFGVTGVDGLFRKNCERVYSALRNDSEKVMCVLNILKWDPLYSWVMSPVTKHKHLLEEDTGLYSNVTNVKENSEIRNNEDNNQESYRALKGVEEKLVGGGLSVAAKIQELIQEATSPDNLSVIYMGWSPFY